MKANSMKMSVIVMLILLMAGVLSGLFFIAIPQGNADVLYMLLGMLANDLGHAVGGIYKKEN